MTFTKTEDESPRIVEALRRPSRFAARILARQVALKHRGEAVQIAAPIEFLGWLQITVAPGVERSEQPRRLVVVVFLPADRQRCRKVLARHQREREVDQPEPRENRIKARRR